MSESRHILFYILVPVAVLFLLFGCALYTVIGFKYLREGRGSRADGQTQGANPVDVLTTQLQVTLARDPPPTIVEAHKLLFRIHDTNDWYLLG